MADAEIADLQAQLEAANARAERADGLFRAADLEINRLKVELANERMARQDAEELLRCARQGKAG